MILTNDQIRACLRGAVEIAEQNGRLVPYRFGKYVRESVYPVGNRFHDATLQASGVTLDLVTDSARFAFTYAANPGGAGHSFDLYLDNVMVLHAPCKTADTLTLELPEGEHRVTVYFPHHSMCEVVEVTLEDGASLSPAPAPALRILFVGDSITHGSTSAFASMTYPHQTARHLNAELINQGIGGAVFNPFAVDDELPYAPDLVVLAFGTNDWSLTTRGIFVGAVNGQLARLRDKYPTTPIVALLPIWRADNHRMTKVGSFEDMRALLRAAAERFDVTVIDGVELVPHVTSVFADNRLHPNAFGFQFYAEELAKRLIPLIGTEK